jgi:head-tail adaptor
VSEFAGLLGSRIEIWRRTDERLPTGLSSNDWELTGLFRAQVEIEGVGKQVEGMSMSALCRYRILLRAHSGIAVDQRVHWQGRRLVIRQVLGSPATPDRVTLRCEELRA